MEFNYRYPNRSARISDLRFFVTWFLGKIFLYERHSPNFFNICLSAVGTFWAHFNNWPLFTSLNLSAMSRTALSLVLICPEQHEDGHCPCPEGESFKIKDFRVYFSDVNASRRESPSACKRRPPPSRILSKRWRDGYPQANMLPVGGFCSCFFNN